MVLTKFLETAARAPGAPGGAAGAAAAGAGVVDGDFVPLEASPAERCVCAVLATRLLKVVSQVSLPPPLSLLLPLPMSLLYTPQVSYPGPSPEPRPAQLGRPARAPAAAGA